MEPSTRALEEKEKKDKKNMFKIATSKRVFNLYADKPEEMRAWMSSIEANVQRLNGGNSSNNMRTSSTGSTMTSSSMNGSSSGTNTQTGSSQYGTMNYSTPVSNPPSNAFKPNSMGEITARNRLEIAKKAVNFLRDESKHQVCV